MLLIAVITMWTACSSDIVDGIQPTEQNKGVVTIHVSNPAQGPLTRATVVGDYDVNVTSGRAITYPTTGKITNYKYIWSVGDKLYTLKILSVRLYVNQ